MADCIITNTEVRLFLLNSIELAAAIFRGPNTQDWEAIRDSGIPQLLSQAPDEPEQLTATLEKLQDSIPTRSEISSELEILETEYVRLFVSAGGGIIAPLYESCHLSDAPRIMGDSALSMQSRLNECDLEVSLDSNEPPDHLSLELEYLYHLLATAWTDNNSGLETKARDFARHEMLPWVKRFHESLVSGTPHPVYDHAARLAEEVLQRIGG